MGLPIARRLLERGYPLAVHNRSQASVRELAALGATALPNPAAVARASDVVLTALPTPDAVRDVYLGADGLVAPATAGALLIDLSTVAPELSREIHAAAGARDVAFLDAPISGGPEGAAAGTLTIMCGGDAAAFERARPVFAAFGERIYHAGPPGAGSTVKLVNQLLVSIHAVAAAEAFALARQGGVDPDITFEIVGNAWGGSRILARCAPLMAAGAFDGGANIAIVLKDAGIIQDAAREGGLPLHLAATARDVLQRANDMGLGNRDIAALILTVDAQPA
jgi:3-hydroxyisobutyrate dehydrogenase/2-hydroxy-3-oxopropionate reductase